MAAVASPREYTFLHGTSGIASVDAAAKLPLVEPCEVLYRSTRERGPCNEFRVFRVYAYYETYFKYDRI